jgi:hypothetical protein
MICVCNVCSKFQSQGVPWRESHGSWQGLGSYRPRKGPAFSFYSGDEGLGAFGMAFNQGEWQKLDCNGPKISCYCWPYFVGLCCKRLSVESG